MTCYSSAKHVRLLQYISDFLEHITVQRIYYKQKTQSAVTYYNISMLNQVCFIQIFTCKIQSTLECNYFIMLFN